MNTDVDFIRQTGQWDDGYLSFEVGFDGRTAVVTLTPAGQWIYGSALYKCFPDIADRLDERYRLFLEGDLAANTQAQATGTQSDTWTNNKGGSQSKLTGRSDLLPADVLLRIADVLATGAERHGAENWKLIDADDHLNHALTHIYSYQAGIETGEDHIIHSLCRLLFLDHVNHMEKTDA